MSKPKVEAEKKTAAYLKDPSNLNSKKWWQLAKTFIQKDSPKTSSFPPLKVGNNTICDDQEKAESFNAFFLEHSTLNEDNVPHPANNVLAERTLSSIRITNKDVVDLLKCLNITKATGPDQVSHAMLKMAGDIIAPSLTRLFNLSLSTSVFPSLWKRANVVPIFKKNDRAVRDNYRPVSLLSCVGKLFERSVFKYVFNFLRDTQAISQTVRFYAR